MMKFSVLIAAVVFCLGLKGQSTYYGLGIGQALYWGDLNGSSFSDNLFNNNGIAIQGFVRHHINDYFAASGTLTYGQFRGNDSNSTEEWQKRRNLSFKSSLVELSAHVEYYPLRFTPQYKYYNFSPFIALGVSGFRFNPKASLNGKEYELQPLGTEGQGNTGFAKKYNRIAAALSFGGGIAWKINDRIILHGTLLCKRTNTDYIDDVSGSYVNYNELLSLNGTLAAALADRTGEYLNTGEPFIRQTGNQRGGSSVRDYYFTGIISFSIALSNRGGFKGSKSSIECPKF